MTDDILIVLNEREQLKQQMAGELQVQLTQRGLASDRLTPTAQLSKILRERHPRILVLDYLLGDVGTALDILSEMKRHPEIAHPTVILWTDEPSVSVAVSAMKLGAQDYVEISTSNSLEKILEGIERALKDTTRESQTQEESRSSAADETPVTQDPEYLNCLSLAESLANRNEPLVLLLGPSGAGRNTIARYIHSQRSRPGSFLEIDWDTWPGSVASVCGDSRRRSNRLLANAATVFLDHVDEAASDLIEALLERRTTLWYPEISEPPMLIIGTTDSENARVWQRLLNAQIVEIPALKERPSDFLPLIQRFTIQMQASGKCNKIKFSSELLEQIAGLEWPGNVRELRATIAEALTLPLDDKKSEHEPVGEKAGKLGKNDSQVYRAVLAAKYRWERYHTEGKQTPPPILARRTLDESDGNFRVAAAKLGTTVPRLRGVLKALPGAAAQRVGGN